tara:strand:+ start:168 stop:839 length:672 start_codon:yes stop_codon:yes gene_type:complete
MIVIPARNEAPRVGAVVRAAKSTFPGIPVIVVVNGCTDSTAAVAAEAGAEVLHSEPGYGQALLTAYRHAAGIRGLPWLIQMDADGQHPVSAIPRMIEALQDADVVVGSRLVDGGSSVGWSRRRRWTIRLMSTATRWISGLNIEDVTSGFQAFRPDVVSVLAQEFDPELTDANVLVRLDRMGFCIREIGVPMEKREGGESMHGGVRSAIFAGKTLMAVSQEIRS